MKVFLLCAVVAFAAANICDHKHANADGIEAIKSTASMYANLYTSECSIDGDTLADIFFADENCVALFEQGYCYGNVAMTKYAGKTEKTVTWAKVKKGIKNAQAMGNLACDNVGLCFATMKAAAMECWADDDFKTQIRTNADMLYTFATAYADTYSENNGNDMVSVLMNMAMAEFDSVDSIVDAITDNSEEILSAYNEAVDTASAFCDADCVDLSADYAKATLDATTGPHGACQAVGEFCGGCDAAMSDYFQSTPPPCCLTTVIDKAIDSFDEQAEAVDDLVEEVTEQVDEESQEKINKFAAEAKCARDAYDAAEGACTPAEEA